MTSDEFKLLRRGDIVRNSKGITFVVDANYGDRVTAMTTLDITNPSEFEFVLKAKHTIPEKS